MKVTLKDGAPRSAGSVEINVSKAGNTLEIGATGVDPAPIVLEFYDGKLTLRLYDEKGQPTVIKQISAVPTSKPTPAPTAQETVNAVFTPPAPAAEPTDDEMAAFDAA